MLINTTTIAMNADITITTPGNIFMHAGGDMTLGSGGAMHLKSGERMTAEAGGNCHRKARDITRGIIPLPSHAR